MIDIGKKSNINNLIILFLINPFLSFWGSIGKLNTRLTDRDRNIIFILVSLFFALIAFTQNTDSGDLSRVYEDVVSQDKYFKSSPLENLLVAKHILFDSVNQITYAIIGDVRYITLIWIFLLFYSTFKTVENIFKFKGIDPRNVKYAGIVLSIVFCFFIFTQVTELMKQSTATALTFLAFSFFLNKEWGKAAAIYFVALNIHFSCLFYMPLIFVLKLKNWIIYVVAISSFVFRQFNLMDLVVNLLSSVPGASEALLLGQIYTAAEQYGVEHEGFFQSDSLMFVATFYHFFLISMISKLRNNKSCLLNVCMIMVLILNLSYTNNHNYTRLLTMMFPFYILIFMELKGKNDMVNRILLWSLVFGAFVINLRFFTMRINDASYTTSFVDNSIIKLALYPTIAYLLP